MMDALIGFVLLGGCGSDSPQFDSVTETSDSDLPTSPDSADTGLRWWEKPQDDADGDGFTESEGDCNDADEAVNPDASDRTCDGVDNDCDGQIDESSLADEQDDYLGDLTNKYETYASFYLFPEGDEDSFTFYLQDGNLDLFDLEIWLYQVPAQADYSLELFRLDDDRQRQESLGSADDNAAGGFEFLNFGGAAGFDDTGGYEVVVRSTDGASCSAPSVLQIVVGSW
jgi:hypothetical protein